ncbi:MAG: hypothetical protein M2R45_01506 [Verrucomicrobia subdivision 3 bacterium]|nr:hypothetical protein [Limisphaerales bacterium]MCS1413365.1 hypothetical protein [Limisphaerales bacterium]
MTDEYPAYQTGHRAGLAPKAVNHAKDYIEGAGPHTNTIKGFWARSKRAWHGSHPLLLEGLDASVCSGNLLKA